MLKALLFASAFAASAAAQDTAYVPFLVTANAESATVKAQQGEKIFLKEVASGVEDTLRIILEGVPAFARPGIAAPSPVTMHSSRGRLSLELSPQHYRNAEVSLYSLGGKRVLHGKVNASDAARSISRSDIATGVYVLYVRGGGGGFSTRLSHQGGGMDIDVSFGGGVSPLRKEDIAEFGAWEITVSAEGHESFEYTLNPVIGINELQDITLTPLSSSSSGTPSSSSDDDTPSSSSDDEPSSSSDDGDDSSSSAELPKCGGTEYDPDTHFCLGGAITPLCGGKTFTASQFCHDGTAIHDKCGGEDYDPSTQYCHDGQLSLCDVPHTLSQFCFDGKIYEKCGTDEYDPDTDFCLGTAVTPLCGGKTFTASEFCSGTAVLEKCGGSGYNPSTEFCLGSAVTPLCGGETFTASQFCLGNAVTPLCGGKSFTASEFCLGSTVTPLCGGKSFTASEFCSGSDVLDKCGGSDYNPSIQFCLGTAVTPLCGGETFTASQFCLGSTVTPLCGGKSFTASEFCSGSDVLDKCGGSDYNPSTQFCLGTAVTPLCGGETFTASQFCLGNTVTPLCGGKSFTASEFCSGSDVLDKCGGSDYNPSTQFCLGGAITPLCGGKTFTASQFCLGTTVTPLCGGKTFTVSQFCSGTAVLNKCGGEEYDPSTHYCDVTKKEYGSMDDNGGKTYKTVVIGTQTWMAENLDYDVPDNATDVCYSNQPARCTQYGRLYNWSTAMGLDPSCNTTTCSDQVQSKHQGICPDGWHIPSDAEWTTLTNYVGSSTAGTKLKAASGWNSNGNGTNDFGFSALPGGGGISSGGFLSVGYSGYWWSATEYDANDAYYRDMSYSDYVFRSNDDKSSLCSVRCVQD